MSAHTLAVTLGDPRGIGPEIVSRAVRLVEAEQGPLDLIVLGPEGYGQDFPRYEAVQSFEGSEVSAGLVAACSIERAVALALEGTVGSIVTAPIHKPALRSAGFSDPGHTEMLKRLTGSSETGMLMAAEKTDFGAPLRVLLATTHVALNRVPDLLNKDLIVSQAKLLNLSLMVEWNIRKPRIALCAVNPHASDEGLFGDEESRVLLPAIEELRDAQIEAEGPIPADTVFRRALKGEFDAVIAPYHDVGIAPFKTVTFGKGVNVTLGLPFIRTSPDHGTAFDLVGTGWADPSSMMEAIRMASYLAQNRFDTLATPM
ncbi:MAG: 4-hydroxythreonine-4-phosphate dehydrogenase PdxA [Gemmatimonadota bacterium]|nr:4-hydroxythreonine-4-phosphate dehydrogenase PdxA [Gemmatimonadota bacterium]